MITEGPWKGFDGMRVIRQEFPDELALATKARVELVRGTKRFLSPMFDYSSTPSMEATAIILKWREEVLRQLDLDQEPPAYTGRKFTA